MFSELRHYPRQSIQLDRTDPVPPWIDRKWRGFQDQLRATMERYTKSLFWAANLVKCLSVEWCVFRFNYAPDIVLPERQYEDPRVSGANRYKYFKRSFVLERCISQYITDYFTGNSGLNRDGMFVLNCLF
jgi:hypothetical protein